MTGTMTILKRELQGYFATPLAYIFMVIFLLAATAFTFYLGAFFERGQADLKAFFLFHPWLYLVFVPAIAMRLWAEEKKNGTLELLLTLPIPLTAIVAGKFLAAWLFIGATLCLTFPLWITVNYLGDPDNGVIAASYLGSWLLAGAYLSIGGMISALTKNQVIAFVVGVALSFLLTVAGAPVFLDAMQAIAPENLLAISAAFSLMDHFDAIQKGVIDFRDLFYFLSLIALCLFGTTVAIQQTKED